MLGVLKRRLKAKRPSEKENSNGGRKNVHAKSEPIVPVDMARITSSQRQIHPLFDEKAQLLAYDDSIGYKKPNPTASVKRSPDDPLPNPLLQLPRKSGELVHGSVLSGGNVHPPTPAAVYHPAPNICVEEGRIEFIKSPSEGSRLSASAAPATAEVTENNFDKKGRSGGLYQSSGSSQRKSIGATTRAQQTQADIGDFVEADEKCDIAKEFLEARIKELERLLEAEQKSGQRERLAVARLQRQLARREVIHRDVDRERRLRADTESRLRETVVESERYRATLAGLQREFSRMEDTVRTMLQYKSRCELLNQEKSSLAAAYESRVHQYQNTISKLNQENETLRHQLRLLETTCSSEIQSSLLKRLRSLETENAHISRDADFQRKQYEKCLDDIANQVVRALLSQKGLREEIGNLQRRIKELENQNHDLANILVRKIENRETDLTNTENALIDKSWFPGNYGEKIRCLSATPMTPSSNCRFQISESSDKEVLKNVLRSPIHSLEKMLLPLQRPRSLNLYLHTSRIPISSVGSLFNSHTRMSKLNLVHLSKKEDEGNESPESGNKDEGYSTMSSDVQGPSDPGELSKRELEDLKEDSDETEVVQLDPNGPFASLVLVEDVSDPDIFFIPFNFTVAINPRHSYPPAKDLLPFQHIMRSFSDSHLCLKLSPNAPLLPTPISPSVFFLDLMDKNHPLRRSKATYSLLSKEEEIIQELEETQSSAGSWCSGAAEGCWWDTEYIQHCLRLDDVRLRAHQRDILQLDYDNTELEDWSLSISCEDIAKYSDGKIELPTPGALPCIQESDGCDGEGDPKNSIRSNYLMPEAKESEIWGYKGKEAVEITSWNSAQSMESPGGSWSSVTSNSDYCCHSLNDGCLNDCSKRSSVASDDAESSMVGTDFTRDFYRLVKFESTKSLASNSSRSITNGEVKEGGQASDSNIRESALKNVLHFIAEQQQYCHSREEEDGGMEKTDEQCDKVELKCEDNRVKCHEVKCDVTEPENDCAGVENQKESEANSSLDNSRTDKCAKCVEPSSYESYGESAQLMTIKEEVSEGGEVRDVPDSPDRSPRRQESMIPVPKPSSARSPAQRIGPVVQKTKNRGTRIPVVSTRKPEAAGGRIAEVRGVKPVTSRETNIPVPTGRKIEVAKKKVTVAEVAKVVVADEGSFHERATSKDVIDELNRMIRKGDEITPGSTDGDMKPLDIACCCPTGWVHVERDIDFTDPKARANLLDVMLASSGSSGGSGSSSDSGGDEPVDYSHLHRIHRFRRQRKASATRKQLGVLRYPLTTVRPSIIGRENFFVRYGDKEREAIASFDFLEDFSTTSASGCSSCDTLGSSHENHRKSNPRVQVEPPSPEIDVATPVTPTTPATPSDDSDERTGGPVSLSDSCADSYTESSGSVEDQC